MGRTLQPGFSFPSCAGPPTWGLGGWEGQEHLSRTLALDGLTAHPSCQDLSDSVYDAAQIQLPHRGFAFHDETGEALGGPTDPLTCQPCPGDFSQLLPRPFPLPGTLFLPPVCPSLASSRSSPSLDCEPLEGGDCPGLCPVPRPHTVSAQTFVEMPPHTPPPTPNSLPNPAQKERFAALSKFKSSIYRILIATDVASR